MSTCPNRIVCCGLTARLSSSVFRSRIGLARWHRDAAVQRTGWSSYSTSESPAASHAGTLGRGDSSAEGTDIRRALPRTYGDTSSSRYAQQGNLRNPEFGVQDSYAENTNNHERSDILREASFDLTSRTAAHDAGNTKIAGPSSRDMNRSARRITRHKFRIVHVYDRNGPVMRRVPRRVTAVIDRAQSALQWQGRVISAKSFRHDVEIRLASLFPYVSVPENWRLAYRSLYTAKFHNKEWQPPESMELDDLGRQLIHTLEEDGRTSFESVWQSLTAPQKRFQWPRLALWWLHKSPKHVLHFLLATDKRPYPPFAMVVDCMAYIYKFHYDAIDKTVYQSVISACMDPERWPTVGLTQQGVRLYLLSSDLEEVSRVFKLMRQRDSQTSAPTLLCFMNLFTKYGDVDRAIDALRLIPLLTGPDSSLHSEQVMRHCCKLLMLDSVQDKDGVRNFKILPKLLELGVRPNRDMMNVVLANAFKTGDPQLGQDMLKYMRDHGLEPDSYTYLTLLTDAVARGDRGRVDAVMQEINPKEELKRNPYIASKIFHGHFTFAAKHVDSYADPAGVFLSMLDLYSRFYDLTPLKELRIVPPAYTPFEQGANAEPPAASLYVMLATYLRCKKNSDRAYSLYRRFRELASEGNRIITPLIQFEQFFNEFLYAFRDDPHALPRCVEVVEDMMHPDPRLEKIGEDKVLHAKPTVYTWNILLSAFIYNRQPHAAEKVKEMMKKHGVGYDHTTWNTIISGYANAQDVQATAAAIKEMESHGYTIDSFTLNPLRFLKDPERLRVAIDTLDQKTLEAAQQEQVAEEQEREELLEQGLRRLAAARKQGKS